MNSQPPAGALDRALRALRRYPRRAPLTLAYVCLLLATHGWVGHGLSAEAADRVLGHVSTNLDNLREHPVSALLGSVLFFDGTLTDVASPGFAGTLITLGLGVGCFLARAERRWGAARAVAVFLGGHVVATLLTAGVVIVALRQGWYPVEVRQAMDFGVSYGAQTVLATGTPAVPRRGRPLWVVFVLGWPLGGAEWTTAGPLPDFTTVGHLLAAVLGFALLGVLAAGRRARAVGTRRCGRRRAAGGRGSAVGVVGCECGGAGGHGGVRGGSGFFAGHLRAQHRGPVGRCAPAPAVQAGTRPGRPPARWRADPAAPGPAGVEVRDRQTVLGAQPPRCGGPGHGDRSLHLPGTPRAATRPPGVRPDPVPCATGRMGDGRKGTYREGRAGRGRAEGPPALGVAALR
ncbi:rhomboid-like protein [Streptomyces sp. NRRL F-2664]|uniref:rhomboid-like protein n=1 Tax=Streptomyces sp. NRRL F-2664 TaxID=1463842 RepID=UPI00068EDCAD|nr:rhomboid-like protein [Streptomyces sp. NRRL F-2664]